MQPGIMMILDGSVTENPLQRGRARSSKDIIDVCTALHYEKHIPLPLRLALLLVPLR